MVATVHDTSYHQCSASRKRTSYGVICGDHPTPECGDRRYHFKDRTGEESLTEVSTPEEAAQEGVWMEVVVEACERGGPGGGLGEGTGGLEYDLIEVVLEEALEKVREV
ncbi:hypothetical protein HPB50_004631 [Hyalomma asiaticum]|uniref:Uncharacterized protein n=1 Tax=Hyalomma asiaticum TaxID=266040 RepID=A0ACB7TF40_HYAAI|nr:hypothetical protein HPB50_004631 [Hyalomma asiaticum]